MKTINDVTTIKSYIVARYKEVSDNILYRNPLKERITLFQATRASCQVTITRL